MLRFEAGSGKGQAALTKVKHISSEVEGTKPGTLTKILYSLTIKNIQCL